MGTPHARCRLRGTVLAHALERYLLSPLFLRRASCKSSADFSSRCRIPNPHRSFAFRSSGHKMWCLPITKMTVQGRAVHLGYMHHRLELVFVLHESLFSNIPIQSNLDPLCEATRVLTPFVTPYPTGLQGLRFSSLPVFHYTRPLLLSLYYASPLRGCRSVLVCCGRGTLPAYVCLVLFHTQEAPGMPFPASMRYGGRP